MDQIKRGDQAGKARFPGMDRRSFSVDREFNAWRVR
jgi:hypothetical protein